MVDRPRRLSSFTLRTARLGKVTGVSSTPCSRPRRAVALPDEEGDEREPKERREPGSARGASTRLLAVLTSSLLVRSLLSCSWSHRTSYIEIRGAREGWRSEETAKQDDPSRDEEESTPLLELSSLFCPSGPLRTVRALGEAEILLEL